MLPALSFLEISLPLHRKMQNKDMMQTNYHITQTRGGETDAVKLSFVCFR